MNIMEELEKDSEIGTPGILVRPYPRFINHSHRRKCKCYGTLVLCRVT